MKKKLISLALILAGAPAAQAGSLLLDARVDYNSTTYNDDAGLPDFSKFYLKTGRLDYLGNVDDRLSYRARIAFNKNPTPSLRDSTGSAVEYAYIQYQIAPSFALSLGKNNTEIGGFEGAASGADLYLTSEAYSHSGPGGALTGRNLSTNDVYYMTGAKGIVSFGDHKIYLLATNAEADHTSASGDFDQNYGLLGATWLGAFMDKAIQVRVNYDELNGPNEDDKNTFYGAGLLWTLDPVQISFDYIGTEFKEGASGDKDKLYSGVLKFIYRGWEQWVPHLELTYSEENRGITVSETNKFNGVAGVIEYVPKKDQTFRYHAAITNVTESPDTGGDKTKMEIIVGARLLADFLAH